VLRETRRMVVEWTGGEQVPWEHSAMIGEFYFRPAGAVFADQGQTIDPVEESTPFTQSSLFGRPGNDNQPEQQPQVDPTATMASVSPEGLQAILASLGNNSTIEMEEAGPTLVVDGGGILPAEGAVVWFYDCQGGECGSFEIWTYYESPRPVDLRMINRWNSEQRWSIASVEDERYSILTLDVNVMGATPENIADLLQTFGEQAAQFRDYVVM